MKEGPNSDSEFNESDASQESTMLKSKSSASPWAVQRVAAPSTSSEANVEQKRVQVASSSTSELSDDNDEVMKFAEANSQVFFFMDGPLGFFLLN